MDPQVDEETEMPEEDVVLAGDAVAGVLGDPRRAWVLSVDAIAKEDSSREHSHPGLTGYRVARWKAATGRWCGSNS